MKERYYSESLLRSLAYDDDVNGNCDGMIDFTVIDSISGADVAPVRHGEWREVTETIGIVSLECIKCSACEQKWIMDEHYDLMFYKEQWTHCPFCGAKMDGGNN
jgi:hypothetical protein